MTKSELIITGVVIAACALGFLAGWQGHRLRMMPRVEVDQSEAQSWGAFSVGELLDVAELGRQPYSRSQCRRRGHIGCTHQSEQDPADVEGAPAGADGWGEAERG